MNIKLLLKEALKVFCVIFIFLGTLSGNEIIAQTTSITVGGTIIDETGMPLPGVNVLEKDTSNGVTTDFDGNYSFQVSNSNAIIVVSYVGFATQEIAVAGNTTVNVTLKAELESLDEVVIVGYGSIKKSDVTGSVGVMDEEQLTERSISDPMAAMQGVIAGVQISSSTGRLGDGFDISIRGQNSLNSGSPLYVVDGTPTDGIDFLNPEDIARIDVLKDASSTAIYGSRGSNGVVLVTTKSGASAKGGLTVSFDSYYGIKNVARLPAVMDGDKWWLYHQSAYLATTNLNDPMSITPELLHTKVVGTANSILEQRALANETFDWHDEVLGTGTQSNNYISVSGRSEGGLGYNIGLGLQKETGNMDNESLDKYSFKTSVNQKVNDKISFGANITVALTEQENGNEKAMQDAFRLNPFTNPWAVDENNESIVGEYYYQPGKLRDTDGNYLINKTSTWNPLLQIQGSSDETRRWNMIGNVYFQYNFFDWLSFKSSFSAGYDKSRRGVAYGPDTEVGQGSYGISAELENSSNFNSTWDNQVNIDYTFKEDHSFKLLALQSIYSSRTEGSGLSSSGMPFDTGFYNIGSGDQSTYNLNSYYIKQTLASFALRLNYSFKNKYLLTVTNRWDGSSLFPEGNQWDSFPSAAVAWKINEEDFMQEQDVMSNLKLRVSYGYTGNNTVDPYSSINILDQQTYYDFAGTPANGWYAGALSNANLQWERTKEVNFGVDFGFLNNRINGSVDIYNRSSDGLIMEQKLAKESGWDNTLANVGSLTNKGVELGLSATAINTDKFKWDISMTYANNTNEIESIYGQSESDDPGNNLFIGESIDALYNYVFDGIWQADEREEAASYGQIEGQAKVKDLNNDGKIDPNDDRTVLGSVDPDWTGSLMTSLKYGNFDLSASMITSQGVKVFSEYHQNFADVRDRGRQKADLADWYIPANGAGIEAQYSNSYPQPRNGGTYWKDSKVGYYRDASFTKIKNIMIGYNFKNLNKVKKLRVYLNVIDPFVFTDYDGYDPEWADAGYSVARVSTVTYQAGLSLTF